MTTIYVMSLTHRLSADAGMKSVMRFGYVGSPCAESVVRGFLILFRTLSPYSSMMRQNRSRPTGLSHRNSLLYICQIFVPPMPGSILRTSRMY